MFALFPQSRNFLDVALQKCFIDHYTLRGVLLGSQCEVFVVQNGNASPDFKSLLDLSSHIFRAIAKYTLRTK